MSKNVKKLANLVSPSSSQYLVIAPSGEGILIENQGITNNQAKALALRVFRSNENGMTLKRDDLKARKVPSYNLPK